MIYEPKRQFYSGMSLAIRDIWNSRVRKHNLRGSKRQIEDDSSETELCYWLAINTTKENDNEQVSS